jgi:sugar transferase EpsL
MNLSAKRGFDLIAASAGLVLCQPLLLLLAAAIAVTMGRPVLFRQRRAGYQGRLFTLYKLRTMTNGTDERGQPLPDAERLTRVGRFIRSTSLDELPQLYNVLRGDMSIVGPRPLLAEYLPHYTPDQIRRHEVRPGLTGWHAVNGRNSTSWDEQFSADVWYVDHQSFWLDMRVVARTVIHVLRRDGITQEGQATRQRFDGLLPRGTS